MINFQYKGHVSNSVENNRISIFFFNTDDLLNKNLDFGVLFLEIGVALRYYYCE